MRYPAFLAVTANDTLLPTLTVWPGRISRDTLAVPACPRMACTRQNHGATAELTNGDATGIGAAIAAPHWASNTNASQRRLRRIGWDDSMDGCPANVRE